MGGLLILVGIVMLFINPAVACGIFLLVIACALIS